MCAIEIVVQQGLLGSDSSDRIVVFHRQQALQRLVKFLQQIYNSAVCALTTPHTTWSNPPLITNHNRVRDTHMYVVIAVVTRLYKRRKVTRLST